MRDVRDWLHDRWPKLSPARLRPNRMAQARLSTSDSPAGLVELDQPASRKTILMIMAEGCKMNEAARALTRAGYKVLTVSGVPAALECLRAGQPSLVIVCGLPATSTFMALREATRVPILALISGATEAETVNVLAAGADDCQPASIGADEVVARSRVLLRRSGGRSVPVAIPSIPR